MQHYVLNRNSTKSSFGQCQILQKPSMVLRILLQITQYDWDTENLLKNMNSISLWIFNENKFKIGKNVIYILVSINTHEGNTMSSGNYYCDILDFNIGILWWYYDDNITNFRGISENVYSEATYPTPGKKIKILSWKFLINCCNYIYIMDVLVTKSY